MTSLVASQLRCLIEGALVVSTTTQAFRLKLDPASLWSSAGVRSMSVFHLIVIAFDTIVEASRLLTVAREAAAQKHTVRYILRLLRRELVHHGTHVQLTSHFFNLIASVLLLGDYLPHPDEATYIDNWFELDFHVPLAANATASVTNASLADAVAGAASALNASARRRLKGAGGAGGDNDYTYTQPFTSWPIYNEGAWGALWMLQVAAGLSLLGLFECALHAVCKARRDARDDLQHVLLRPSRLHGHVSVSVHANLPVHMTSSRRSLSERRISNCTCTT